MKLNLKSKIQEHMRVLKITKKPAKKEYSAAIKITGLGIILIGTIGLIIFMIAKITGYIPSAA
ncbi:MAG: protein translocase SEC61 complex subunit gamma [Candidatus Aenigmarchaeota archaeon]|nr:protein translocase SEC61 complex subunit gamma [Candidatus Aenigmarchaeota archaeon]